MTLFATLGLAQTEQPPASDSKEEEKMPEPTVLRASRFVAMKDGLQVGAARFKEVRSNHSGKIFGGSIQRSFKKGIAIEEFKALKKKKKSRLYGKSEKHHIEFSKAGVFEKYRGWWQAGVSLQFIIISREKSRLLFRSEGSGVKVRKLEASNATIPFDPTQIFLVQLAYRRAKAAGGTLPVIEPRTGELGQLTITDMGNGTIHLGGAGSGGILQMDASGKIASYQYKDLSIMLEPTS
ncbi:MAG: hypothetical protein CMH54_13450 [Myxococcales bacterium]|nr:hypothetical protein [Myxococcales bacterium]|tara:strand:+ start:962 stop:1672 length:711 start_codon:yes stop_codon:yes gene_type:complete